MSGTAPLHTTPDPDFFGSNPYKASVVVGTDPWNDISTANYTENWSSARIASAHQPRATAVLPPVDIPSGAVLTSVDFTAIVMLTNEDGATRDFFAVNLTTMDDEPVAFASNGLGVIQAPTDGEWHTVDFIGGVIPGEGWLNNDSDPIDAETLTDLLRAGCKVATNRISGFDATIPYDHMLRTAYLVGVCSWVGGETPPLRHTQRDDNRNSRLNSRQRSLRNTGYL